MKTCVHIERKRCKEVRGSAHNPLRHPRRSNQPKTTKKPRPGQTAPTPLPSHNAPTLDPTLSLSCLSNQPTDLGGDVLAGVVEEDPAGVDGQRAVASGVLQQVPQVHPLHALRVALQRCLFCFCGLVGVGMVCVYTCGRNKTQAAPGRAARKPESRDQRSTRTHLSTPSSAQWGRASFWIGCGGGGRAGRGAARVAAEFALGLR